MSREDVPASTPQCWGYSHLSLNAKHLCRNSGPHVCTNIHFHHEETVCQSPWFQLAYSLLPMIPLTSHWKLSLKLWTTYFMDIQLWENCSTSRIAGFSLVWGNAIPYSLLWRFNEIMHGKCATCPEDPPAVDPCSVGSVTTQFHGALLLMNQDSWIVFPVLSN